MLKKFIIFFFLGGLLLGCSDDTDEPQVFPEFVESVPEDGQKDVKITTKISVSFDETIKLNSSHNITVNENDVEAEANLTKIIIHKDLKKGKEYVVNIPAGAVINTSGGALQNDIVFSFTTLPQVQISSDLVVENPSPEAQNVYNFLIENYGSKIISGSVANVSWNINEAEWVHQHTGKYPAMNTFDFLHLNWAPADWIDYSNTQVVEDWWANNGLVGACWHWNVPESEGVTDNERFTSTASETTFSAANATTEGTWENEIAKADLKEMADYLKLLKDKNIPVIWRPLHEAAGNIYEYDNGEAWFWWGSDGADAFKNLWIYMFEYFEDQGLNNLIWVWTTQTKDEAFYPGDEYVDIIGRDIYDNQDASQIAFQFQTIQDTYPSKMVTLSEMGSVANISSQWSVGAKWSWFMPWYDYERTDDPEEADFNETTHGHADASWWEEAISHEDVITRDEMPDLK